MISIKLLVSLGISLLLPHLPQQPAAARYPRFIQECSLSVYQMSYIDYLLDVFVIHSIYWFELAYENVTDPVEHVLAGPMPLDFWRAVSIP